MVELLERTKIKKQFFEGLKNTRLTINEIDKLLEDAIVRAYFCGFHSRDDEITDLLSNIEAQREEIDLLLRQVKALKY